jgi:hypothetical protein
MKSLSNKVENVVVYYTSPKDSEFRRYCIEVKDRLGEYTKVLQNVKPTLKELKKFRQDLKD